jgi:N-acetylglucosamine-6-phosphate deacetylase
VKALIAPAVFDGTALLGPRAVLVQDGLVADVVRITDLPAGVQTSQLQHGHILAPGFVDLQVNGGGGVMFNDGPDVGTLQVIAEAHAKLGTTSILPTLISSDRPTRLAAIAAARAAITQGIPGIAGLHLEGPFLAMARRGIHPAAAITLPTKADIADLAAPFEGPMLLTLAPEMVSPAVIAAWVAAGRFVFAGHTDADFDQAKAGFDAGIVGTTHLFNAMSQLGSRTPGMVGAAMMRGVAGIIVDLLHVHPASVALAWRCMGPERLFLVSDAMATVGSSRDAFMLGGKSIRLVDGRLADADGTLAGAHLSMADAVRLAVSVGIPLADALRMATRTPADAVGLFDRGRIAHGSRADFVELDTELRVRRVWRGGGAPEYAPPDNCQIR